MKIFRRAKEVPKPKFIDAYKVTTFWDDASNSASVTLKVSNLVHFSKTGSWRQTFDFTMSQDGNSERFFYINRPKRNVCGIGSSVLAKPSTEITCRADYTRNTVKILFDLGMVGGSRRRTCAPTSLQPRTGLALAFVPATAPATHFATTTPRDVARLGAGDRSERPTGNAASFWAGMPLYGRPV